MVGQGTPEVVWWRPCVAERNTVTWKQLMGWILRLPNLPAMLYIAVTALTRRIHIRKNLLYVLFWIIYAMFVEAAFLI